MALRNKWYKADFDIIHEHLADFRLPTRKMSHGAHAEAHVYNGRMEMVEQIDMENVQEVASYLVPWRGLEGLIVEKSHHANWR